jgi:hypothetical protein
VEAEKGGVKKRHAVEGVLESSALAAGSEKTMGGISVKRWVNRLLGFVHLGLGRVLVGLLEGLLKGIGDIPVNKWIRALLKTLNGSKGLGPSFKAYSAGLANGLHKIGFGFPLKPNRATQPSCWVRPPACKSSSWLAFEVHLGASDAVPSNPVRSAIYGTAPGDAWLMYSELVSTFALQAPSAYAGSGHSLAVRQIPPVSLLLENPDMPASQACLDVLVSQACLMPEPLDVGSPVQAHKIGTDVDGSSLGAVVLSKLDCSPAYSLP